jgi:putative CGCGG family rSAM target protein
MAHERQRPSGDSDPVHEGSWSANLEEPAYAADPDAVVADALDAVARTVPGTHVNLVTHGDLGHPKEYLYPELEAALDASTVEYVDQCGCGGHVTRVHVAAPDGADA